MKDREQKNQYSKRNFPYPKTVNAANASRLVSFIVKGTPAPMETSHLRLISHESFLTISILCPLSNGTRPVSLNVVCYRTQLSSCSSVSIMLDGVSGGG
jgi:hypothetical protein